MILIRFLVRVLVMAVAMVPLLRVSEGAPSDSERPVYRSPFDVVLTAGDTLAAVSDRTAGKLVIIDVALGRVQRQIDLNGEPTALTAGPGGTTVFVSEYDAGSVAQVDVTTGAILGRWQVGRRPMGIAVLPGRDRLLVANTTAHDVSVVDLKGSDTPQRASVPREAFFVAAVPGGNGVVAANLLPTGSPGTDSLRTYVSVIDVSESGAATRKADIELPAASTSVREIVVSGDGRRAFVVHTLGRIHVPTTQLERGWVSTNALSTIDIENRRLVSTVLLDRVDEGASDPWGLCLSPSGDRLWVGLRGTHQIVHVDLGGLDRLLESRARAGKDPLDLRYDLETLYQEGILQRTQLEGRGPRGMDVSRDGSFLVVACYYSGTLDVIDAQSGVVRRSIPVGDQPEADLIRRGEQLFHDATISFQSWLSCSTCHPDRGRNDGLHWDLPNDGIGTPQMTRSLLSSYLVAPTTARGARPGFEASVTAGFRFLHTGPTGERIEAIMAYLSSLEPEPSPFLARDGQLTAKQVRGQQIFEGKGECIRCHKGEIRTDLKPHTIGTASEHEPGGRRFYTPKLIELYRTAPFLHDGRAGTLKEIFQRWNVEERHGKADELSEAELDDLLAFLMTL
jgi:DNA-binding beta-propeller fold protein YncE